MLRLVEPQELASSEKKGFENMEAVKKEVKDPLYYESKGCDKDFSVLHMILELFRLKCKTWLVRRKFQWFIGSPNRSSSEDQQVDNQYISTEEGYLSFDNWS